MQNVESPDVCPDWPTSVCGLGSTKSRSHEHESESGSLETSSARRKSASGTSSAKTSLGKDDVCLGDPRECETFRGSGNVDVDRGGLRGCETSRESENVGAGEDSLDVEGQKRRARTRVSENYRVSEKVDHAARKKTDDHAAV